MLTEEKPFGADGRGGGWGIPIILPSPVNDVVKASLLTVLT